MAVEVMNSEAARANWHKLIDIAVTGETDTIIEQAGDPVAAVIPYADYEALLETLYEIRAMRRADEAMEEYRRDPDVMRPLDELRKEWIAEGLLDP